MADRGGGQRNTPRGSNSGVTTKLFVGNLPETVRKPDFLALFQKYGKVVECDIVKNFAFVHYEDEVEAKASVAALHESEFMGVNIRVEISHSKVRRLPGMGERGECYRCGGDGHWSKDCPVEPMPRGSNSGVTTKLFVGNLPETVRKPDFLALFQKYGKVVECDIVKNFAFVHYEDEVEAKASVAALHESEFMGVNIRVEISHSKVRRLPGMGGRGECYRCGGDGHWSKDCPGEPTPYNNKQRGRGGGPPGGDFGYDRDPYRDPYYGRDRYDDRERYPPPPDRYKPYGDPYDRRAERRPPPPPPPSVPYFRDRDPYGRPPPDYYLRLRSPPRDPYYSSYYDRRGDDPYYDYYAYYYRRPPPPPPGYERESSEDGAPPPPPHQRSNSTDFIKDEPQFIKDEPQFIKDEPQFT